jgi:hypothetical protein
MTERAHAYAAALLAAWYGEKSQRDVGPIERAGVAGDTPVFTAGAGSERIALAVAQMYEPGQDQAAEDTRAFMEERLTGGLVRGPFLLWVPPHASVPGEEPEASGFAQRVQQAAAPLQPGARGEVELPVTLQVAKLRDEGGYASVIGGLSRWWTLITERVNGTVQVNASQIRRAPQSSMAREALFDRIGEAAKPLQSGQGVELDAVEAWTVQRLPYEPAGARGFAIVQAPPKVDPSDGSIMRRLVRRRLKDAAAALQGIDAPVKGVGLIAVYEYAEHENLGAFVKSLDPALFVQTDLIAAIVDGDVRPILLRR